MSVRTTSASEVCLSNAPLRELRAKSRECVDMVLQSPGICHVVLHRGKCVLTHANGWMDAKGKVPFGPDTLCRLHGATKPLVAAAFLTLVDEGRVRLSDPISKFIPFSDRVRVGRMGKSRPVNVRPNLRHLLSMTAGLGDEECPAYHQVMDDVRSGKISNLAEFTNALAELPLEHDPGAHHHDHSLCTDILGRVCEAVSGKSLETFVRKNLLVPLGMKDTHFLLPPNKTMRAATLFEVEPTPMKKQSHGRQKFRAKVWKVPAGDVSAPGIFQSGGGLVGYSNGGMRSTARDQARFCQMLLDGGRTRGGRRRVLKEATVRSLWLDSLRPYARADGYMAGFDVSQDRPCWEGWSLVNAAQDHSKPSRVHGSPSKCRAIWMYGGSGPCWLVDPARQLVAISFMQCMFGGGPLWSERSHYGEPFCYSFAQRAVDEGTIAGKKRARRGASENASNRKRARTHD
eukprot:TRINITY_DN13713_c0_g1_i1.p1 TRINITY_DN13713_c0_g1~~TRINITY_DN13713_c0_g1_i1.p1  ORF type:complete len:458 (-),score=42.97 TRINITY_DN13713_c0_g1_i1:179-1552(-)